MAQWITHQLLETRRTALIAIEHTISTFASATHTPKSVITLIKEKRHKICAGVPRMRYVFHGRVVGNGIAAFLYIPIRSLHFWNTSEQELLARSGALSNIWAILIKPG